MSNYTWALSKTILNEYDKRVRVYTYGLTSTSDGVTHISGLTLQSAALMHYGEFRERSINHLIIMNDNLRQHQKPDLEVGRMERLRVADVRSRIKDDSILVHVLFSSMWR